MSYTQRLQTRIIKRTHVVEHLLGLSAASLKRDLAKVPDMAILQEVESDDPLVLRFCEEQEAGE